MLGGNPVFTAPADLRVRGARSRKVGCAPTSASTTTRPHASATGTCRRRTTWRAGATCAPPTGRRRYRAAADRAAYGGKTAHEVLAALLESSERTRATTWCASHLAGHPARRRRLRDVLAARAARRRGARHAPPARSRSRWRRRRWPRHRGAADGGLEVVFRPDPHCSTGASRTTAGSRSCRDPITKLTWDNAALVAPATAERLGLATATSSSWRTTAARLRAPVWIVPGHATESVTAHVRLRPHARRARRGGVGVDVYPLRSVDRAVDRDRGARAKTGEHARHSPPRRTTTRWRAGRSSARRRSRSTARTRIRAARWSTCPRATSRCIRASRTPAHAWGMADRPGRVHRLQRLRRRVPGREQHPGRRQGGGAARPRDALDPDRPLLHRASSTRPRRSTSPSSACTARTRRARSSAR